LVLPMRQCSIDWWSDTPDNRRGVFAAGEIEVALHESAAGPSRHLAAMQNLVRNRGVADIE
jgi:hypothetical protein